VTEGGKPVQGITIGSGGRGTRRQKSYPKRGGGKLSHKMRSEKCTAIVKGKEIWGKEVLSESTTGKRKKREEGHGGRGRRRNQLKEGSEDSQAIVAYGGVVRAYLRKVPVNPEWAEHLRRKALNDTPVITENLSGGRTTRSYRECSIRSLKRGWKDGAFSQGKRAWMLLGKKGENKACCQQKKTRHNVRAEEGSEGGLGGLDSGFQGVDAFLATGGTAEGKA